jgi:hypothetical protein
LKVLEGYAITSTEAANGLVNKTVLRSWLQALPDNRQITVTCKVTFDGSTAEAQAVTFKTTTYTIRAAVPTFVFNTSPVTRSQIQYLWKDRPDLRPANGIDQFQYQATGGQPGYTYTSSNTACAVVDSVGRVVIRNNGNTTITARDSGGRQLSYTVTVSNVRFFQDNGQGGGYLECVKIASNRGGRLPNLGELRAVYNAYIGVWKGQAHTYFWSTDSAGFLSRHGKNLSNGGEASLSELGNCLCLVML